MRSPTEPSTATALRLIAAAVLLVASLGACQPVSTPTSSVPGRSGGASTLAPIARYANQALPTHDPWLSLVGDAAFDASTLGQEQRTWHERLKVAVERSLSEMLERAEGGDSYDYGRWLFQFDAALLIGLRTTGDLWFLDQLDTLAEAMRADLRDGWCGDVSSGLDVSERYGTVTEPDGYRNFRWRYERGHRNYCRDVGDLDEALVHGHLAMVMYAYHANRHLEGPAGIDYGERADFWMAYLRDDFEAKWRERSATPWPEMDFIDLKFCHTYAQMILYYYFVGTRLQEENDAAGAAYLHQALRLSDGLFDVDYVPGRRPGGFVEVDTPKGPAFVYSFGAPGNTDVARVHLEACPTTYARYMVTSLLALRLEGFQRWDDAAMAKLATGVAHFVMDTDDLDSVEAPFAAGVTGDATVAGIPRTRYSGRNSVADLSLTPFAALAAWDASGRIAEVVAEVYADVESDPARPEQVYIPAGELLVATIAADGALRPTDDPLVGEARD